MSLASRLNAVANPGYNATEEFHDGLEKYRVYVDSLLNGDINQFSPDLLRQIIDSFKGPLRQHLADEIDTLLNLNRFDGKEGFDLEKIAKEAHEHAMAENSVTKTIPVFMLNHDRTFAGSDGAYFPPMPPVVSWVFRRIIPCWHWGWWKFTTCDGNQMPKSLPYI
jgi:hypothetical protein